MAYIPPHKRHSVTPEKLTPPPPSFTPRHYTNTTSNNNATTMRFAPNCISLWFLAGPDGRPVDSNHINLQPFSCESIERRHGNKPMIIVHNPVLELQPGDAAEEPPWVFFAKRILPDIIEASWDAREEACSEAQHFKMSFVMKVGNILFPWDSPRAMDYFEKAVDGDRNVRVRKNFNTSVPKEFLENLDRLLPEIGFSFGSEKDNYKILVVDKHRPDIILMCKCKVQSDGTLELQKVETSQLRYLVADTSCLCKDLDLRLMLDTKKIFKILNVDEKDEIIELVSSAILDPEVKGGLRWPHGNKFVAGRFESVGVWHTIYRKFRGSLGCMYLRNADRFYNRDLSGEVDNEVTLKLNELSNLLNDDTVDWDTLLAMVQDAVKLFWNHLLNYKTSS